MSLVPKEILLSHLQRAEGAEEVTLPIDFFRDLLYQAMQRTWVGLTWSDVPNEWVGNVAFMEGAKWAETKNKEKNSA